MTQMDEIHMLKEVSEGNQLAFGFFYDRYHSPLLRRVCSILNNKEQTEEVLQDVFSKIWIQRTSITKIQDIESYLFILARNSCLNVLKANIRKQALETTYCREYTQQDHLPLEKSSIDDYYDWLEEAVERLPCQQKKVYLLSRVSRKRYLDIADELDISKETVKKYLQLANQSIKNHLSKHKDSIVSFFFILSFL